MNNLQAVLHSALAIMTPILLAACGGLFTSLAGMLNIALEGLLLAGAFAAVAAVFFTGSLWMGLAAAIFVSMALAALHAFTSIKLRSNVFITGLAVNLLAGGLTIVLSQSFFNTRGVVALHSIHRLPQMAIPLVSSIPFLGNVISGHSVYIYVSWFLVLLAWVLIYQTPFGYRLRACNKHPTALSSLGMKPDTYRCIAFLISGFYCGIGGSLLSLNLGVFVPNMTAGKGWIALVVIFLGAHRPLGVFIAAFVFGLAESFSNYAQGLLGIPADFILALPYLLTLLAMVLVSIVTRRQGLV